MSISANVDDAVNGVVNIALEAHNHQINSIDDEVKRVRKSVHDINNALTRVTGHIMMLEKNIESSAVSIKKLSEKVDSVSALIEKIKAFTFVFKAKTFWLIIFLIFFSIDYHKIFIGIKYIVDKI